MLKKFLNFKSQHFSKSQNFCDFKSQFSKKKSQLKSQKSQLKSQKSRLKSQKSRLKSQKSRLKSQKSQFSKICDLKSQFSKKSHNHHSGSKKSKFLKTHFRADYSSLRGYRAILMFFDPKIVTFLAIFGIIFSLTF